MMQPSAFYGHKVILSELLVEDGPPCEVQRTWRERLFTRPWRPLQATRTVVPKIPYRGVLQLNDTLVMHPATYQQLKEQLERDQEGHQKLWP